MTTRSLAILIPLLMMAPTASSDPSNSCGTLLEQVLCELEDVTPVDACFGVFKYEGPTNIEPCELIAVTGSEGGTGAPWYGVAIANSGNGLSLQYSETKSWLFIGYVADSGPCGDITDNVHVDGEAVFEFVHYWALRAANPSEWPEEACFLTGDFPEQVCDEL